MVRGSNQPVSGEPDLSHWELVDIFTVDQAVCLWAGIDPSKNLFERTVSETSRLASICQFLSAAIQVGQIPADSSRNSFEIIGNYSKSLVTRDDLKTLANSKGQQPNFLFDTLMPEIGGKELPKSENDRPSKSKGGRPREYDWVTRRKSFPLVRGSNQPVSGKPDLSHWELVDIFTVDQAACLWAGIDPSKNRFETTVSETSRLASVDQFLSAAIQTGQIPADSSKNSFEIIGNYSKSLVTRDDLKTLANSKGQQPNFLFDTLMPEIGGKELPKSENDRPSKSKGGRPREYDWDALTIEIIRIANSPDGLPETQSELIERLLQWCENAWGKQPADSSVKSRVSKIYNELGLGHKPPG